VQSVGNDNRHPSDAATNVKLSYQNVHIPLAASIDVTVSTLSLSLGVKTILNMDISYRFADESGYFLIISDLMTPFHP
jgi:hypothetical protein